MEDKKSKPVYVGKERGEPVPAPTVGACILVSGIFVLTFVSIFITPYLLILFPLGICISTKGL